MPQDNIPSEVVKMIEQEAEKHLGNTGSFMWFKDGATYAYKTFAEPLVKRVEELEGMNSENKLGIDYWLGKYYNADQLLQFAKDEIESLKKQIERLRKMLPIEKSKGTTGMD